MAKPKQPLRGEAAWQAARTAMAKKNDQARDRMAVERADHDARAAARRREIEQMDARRPGDEPR